MSHTPLETSPGINQDINLRKDRACTIVWRFFSDAAKTIPYTITDPFRLVVKSMAESDIADALIDVSSPTDLVISDNEIRYSVTVEDSAINRPKCFYELINTASNQNWYQGNVLIVKGKATENGITEIEGTINLEDVVLETVMTIPASSASVVAHLIDTENPHQVTATQIAATQTSDYRFVSDAEKADWNTGGASVSGIVYYIDSVGGVDTNSGLSPSGAKKTISAVKPLIVDGDTVLLKRGSRFRERVNVLDKIVHIKSYGGGERPIVDFSKLLDNNAFTPAAGYANVYEIAISYSAIFGDAITTAANNVSPQVFVGAPAYDKNGLPSGKLELSNGYFNATSQWVNIDRTHVQHLEYVRDNPGTLYIANVAGTNKVTFPLTDGSDQFKLYIHLPDSSDPVIGGSEISLSDWKHDAWAQRVGGSLEDVWFTRSGNSLWGLFENLTIRNIRSDGVHRHGPIVNSCQIYDSESYAVYGAGYCWHGFRTTSLEGTDNGLEFYRCKAVNGAYAYGSHGSGGVKAQLYVKMEDCAAENVWYPVDFSVEGSIVNKRFDAKNVIFAPRGLEGIIIDSVIQIKDFDAADSMTNQPIFLSPNGEYINSFLHGGVGRTNLLQDGSGTLTIRKSTVLCTGGTVGTFTGSVKLYDSIWMGSIDRVTEATNSYIDQLHLDQNGDHKTILTITGCYSKLRNLDITLTPYSDIWQNAVKPITTVTLTAGSNQVRVQGSGDVQIRTSDMTFGWKINDGAFSWAANPITFSGPSNDITITMDRTAPESRTISYITGTTQYRMTKLRALQSGADTIYAHPHGTTVDWNKMTLYGDAEHVEQVVAGVWIRVKYNTISDGKVDFGTFLVMNRAGDVITLDAVPDWKSLEPSTRLYPSTDSGLTTELSRTPQLEITIAATELVPALAKLTDASGFVWTKTTKNYITTSSLGVTRNAPHIKIENGAPGQGFDITLSGSVDPALLSAWTLGGTGRIYSLEPKFQAGRNKIKRLAHDSYLRRFDLGCDL